MGWHATAVVGWTLAALLAAAAPTQAAEPATDADLQREAAGQGDQQNVDAGTGKTLQERIRAVSRRTFLKADRFELAPQAGITTNDPFFRSWAFGTRASWHFSEEFSLDAGGAFAAVQEQLDIFRTLNVDPKDIDLTQVATTSLVGYGDVGVTFSPFYGKVALASELVGHFDIFVSSGLAVVVDGQATAPAVHPALEVGLGSRLFLNRWLALRADVRDYLYPSDINGELVFGNLLLLNVGVGIFFPLDFDYSAETLGAKD
jgi:outer membrane beta-barrel protein